MHHQPFPVSTNIRFYVAVQRRCPTYSYQAPRFNRVALDPSGARVQLVHPTHSNRHTTVAPRLGVNTRGTLRHPLPNWAIYPRPQRQGLLPACHE